MWRCHFQFYFTILTQQKGFLSSLNAFNDLIQKKKWENEKENHTDEPKFTKDASFGISLIVILVQVKIIICLILLFFSFPLQPWSIRNATTGNGFTSEDFVSFTRRPKFRTSISATRRRRRCLVSKRKTL